MNESAKLGVARLAVTQGGVDAAVLYDPARVAAPVPDMFTPDYWRQAAMAVSSGGRGSAWFIDAGAQHWVLRQYRRGGLAARLSKDRYLWLGEAATRSFAEFRLLQTLLQRGLPVPVPVAAFYTRATGCYRAALLMQRLPEVTPLPAFLDASQQDGLWQSVGQTLAQFHRAGVDHADLNANNIMVSAQGCVFVIDFDRCRLRSPRSHWREKNMSRLQRSLAKLGGAAANAPWRSGWRELRAAYDAAMAAP